MAEKFKGRLIRSDRYLALKARFSHWGEDAGNNPVLFIYCSTKSCRNTLRIRHHLYLGWDHCVTCRQAKKTLFGVHLRSYDRWLKIGDRLLGIKTDKKKTREKTKGPPVFIVKCKTEGCLGKQRLTSIREDGFCASCNTNKRREGKRWWPHYKMTQRSAETRGHLFAWPFKDFQKFCEGKQCFYCRKPLERVAWANRGQRQKSLAAFVDRLDNKLGYRPDNVTSCCLNCNKRKGWVLTCRTMRILYAAAQKDNLEAHRLIEMSDDEIHKEAVAFAVNQAAL